MRIVIDLQGAQTESRFRGIGRYSMALARALVLNRGEHEVLIALSGLLPDTIEPIRAAFDGLLPQESIRVWYAPGPVKECEPGNEWRREVAEIIREAFLASLHPDVVLVTSLFEGYVDDAVTSIGAFAKLPTAVVLYDLIPLLNPEMYLLPNPTYRANYERKIESLKNADLMLAISESAAHEGRQALGLDQNRVVNISTACDAVFRLTDLSEKSQNTLLNDSGISKPFVLYSGGADDRKNLPRLVQAYAQLPAALRQSHQLVFAGKMPQGNVELLRDEGKRAGLHKNEIVFTGYISDDTLAGLYNLCKVFVFPSLHEGFGLPALEAMSCGAPVICANTSSLPEVIGLDEALFDPLNVSAITSKIAQALEDEIFCNRLREHGMQRARLFSWDKTAKLVFSAWEGQRIQPDVPVITSVSVRKPRLAFVSPLPPERTGIADYSAQLLPSLAEQYDIEVVVAQEQVDDPFINRHIKVRDVAWLREHAVELDRVLYHIGNSPFHQHMIPLLREIPGTVVLHDFFLSSLMSWLELHAGISHAWTKSLYAAHGYDAVQKRYCDAEVARREYPVNIDVLQHAQGIIVHSEYSRQLASRWYGDSKSDDWAVIPLLRPQTALHDKGQIKQQLGFDADDFIICSFGFLDSTKLNHRLLNCWLNSSLALDNHCYLIFVGENHSGDYGAQMLQTIKRFGKGNRIRITGFATPEAFRQYLMASDLAVQLRTESRGETSAAVLDCMSYALPTIVNANGSMAEQCQKTVWMLPDGFCDEVLVEALEILWREPERRRILGERAREVVLEGHAPAECAERYKDAIERFHRRNKTATPNLIKAIVKLDGDSSNKSELLHLSKSIALTFPLARPAKCLLLDVTATCRNDLKTGIERVVRALLLALIKTPPTGYRIEPVYLDNVGGKWIHRYARRYTLGLLGCPSGALNDEVVEPEVGDILLALDLSGDMLVQAQREGLFAAYRNNGVAMYSMVYDLLPIRMPDVFPPGAAEKHKQWLQAVSTFDGAIGISKAVADDLANWHQEVGLNLVCRRPYRIGWSHLGADVFNSAPSLGMPDDAKLILDQLKARKSFLMVGTIEPRKGYLQTIDAFTQLWNDGFDVNLVIVGKEGWKVLPDNMCRDIPDTVQRLRNHSELHKHLFWLDDVSDEYLEAIYAASTCLIAASYGEGFGVPLIEAAQHKIPIIARDIPVFREIAADYAFYFNADTSAGLARSLKDWLLLHQENRVPLSNGMRFLTWKESAIRLVQLCSGF